MNLIWRHLWGARDHVLSKPHNIITFIVCHSPRGAEQPSSPMTWWWFGGSQADRHWIRVRQPHSEIGAIIKGIQWISSNRRPHSSGNPIPRTDHRGSASDEKSHPPLSSVSDRFILTPGRHHTNHPPRSTTATTNPNTKSTTPSLVKITNHPPKAPRVVPRVVWPLPSRHYQHPNPNVSTPIHLPRQQSPIYSWNNGRPITPIFQTPTHIDLYDETTNLQDHLESFRVFMLLSTAPNPIMCRAFLITLKMAKLWWFTTLLP